MRDVAGGQARSGRPTNLLLASCIHALVLVKLAELLVHNLLLVHRTLQRCLQALNLALTRIQVRHLQEERKEREWGGGEGSHHIARATAQAGETHQLLLLLLHVHAVQVSLLSEESRSRTIAWKKG